MASDLGPVFFGILAVLVLFFFFVYLLLRRTLLSFREGQDRTK
jgi:flagellar biogenesis protein FliO